MPQFRVVIEDTQTVVRSKIFTADSAEDARQLAEEDLSWTPADGWDDLDPPDGNCEILTVETYEETTKSESAP